ncbi:UPF0489 family protein [Priestia megaterium]|uniref:UPF0489 family protein n=1 Tax=Priestia megaterium TaxID=1404 RepID=UPI0034585EF7
MSRILDIDMDFFLNDIAHWVGGEYRLNDSDYLPWLEKDFRIFLEERCLLSKNNPVKGRIIKNHNEAFFFWDELIKNKIIDTPFEVTHIDAHSDTGLGDNGYVYIVKELMHYPIDRRREMLDIQKVSLGNYMSYALACGWISNVDFVLHDLWEDDIMNIHLKNFDIEESYFKFKAYDKSINISLAFERIRDGRIKPVREDLDIPFSLTFWDEFQAEERVDYIVFCQSLGSTPKTADYMLEIIKDYTTEI